MPPRPTFDDEDNEDFEDVESVDAEDDEKPKPTGTQKYQNEKERYV